MNFKGYSAVSKILPRTGSINWAGFRIRILDLDPDQAKEKKIVFGSIFNDIDQPSWG